jgi:hypothetical protein
MSTRIGLGPSGAKIEFDTERERDCYFDVLQGDRHGSLFSPDAAKKSGRYAIQIDLSKIDSRHFGFNWEILLDD